MYKVTYLDRNGFIVVNDDVIMVFDYHTDPSHALHHALEQNPDKPVVFFVTYHENTHFNKSIFELAQNHKRTYVMSNDVYPQNVPDTLAVAGMSKGDIIEGLPGNLDVKAYGSSGKGIAFLVTDGNKRRIFHAGSMNDPEIDSRKSDKHTDSHSSVVTSINRIADEINAMDIAFIAADTDMESQMARRTLLFLDKIKVANYFPIHIGSGNKTAEEYAAYAVNGAEVHYLRVPGQSISL